MKRILSIVLILILSLSVLVACGGNDEVTYEIDNAKAMIHDLYDGDLAPEKDATSRVTYKDFNVTKVLNAKDGKYTVVWTTDKAEITVVDYAGSDAGFTADNTATVKMPTDNNEEIAYVLTATITAPDGKTKATVTYSLVAPAATKALVPVKNPQVGVAYKFGMYQSQKGQTLFITGEMAATYYFGTTEDASVSPDVYLEATEGGYYVYTFLNGAKKYINMEVKGTYVNAVYGDAASTVVTIQEDGALVTTVNEKTYAYGTYGSYTTIGTTDMSKEGYPVRLYAMESHVCSFEEATCTAPATCVCGATNGEALGHLDENNDHNCDRTGCSAKVGDHADGDDADNLCDYGCGVAIESIDTSNDKAYKVKSSNADGDLWLIGSISDGRFNCSANESDAVLVYVHAVEGGYHLYMLVDGTITYLVLSDSSQGAATTTDASAATIMEWNATLNTYVVADDTNNRALAGQTNKTYTTMSPYDVGGSNTSNYDWAEFILAQ